MLLLPQKNKGARTGSNLRGKSTLTPRQLAQSNNWARLQRLARAFRQERTQLISKAELRAAAGLAREIEMEWQQASLGVDGDIDRRQELKKLAKKKLERKLGHSIPGFRAYQALKKAYLKERGKIAGAPPPSATTGDLTLGLLEREESPSVDFQEFVAPFPRYEILTGDIQGALAQDDSFIRPDTGQWVQNFAFAHNESSWLVSSRAVFVDHFASCGVDFTMPRDGRLQVAAEMENFSNRLNCSISDNFGFSHSYLEASVNLFVAIVRRDVPTDYYQVRLIRSVLNSEGDDLDRSISDLATFVPYGMGALTLHPLPAGEKVTVLAGAHVRINSDTDDMDAHVRATYWWRLRKLQLGVRQ
ncbi:MAG: hypothetical protein ABIZ81_13790 [Opitutaceae bacterium]